MKVEGGCYCGAVRYLAEGDALLKAQCHCRECQYMTGGAPNIFMMMPIEHFQVTQGTPKPFRRKDLENPVTREFCSECGTHLLTHTPRRPDAVILKVGTLDDPDQFGKPAIAIFTCDQQPYHQIPEDVKVFERLPG